MTKRKGPEAPHPCSLPPAAAALLSDDMLLEFFLRLPPEPHYLYTISFVCKRWCRLVRDPDFLRRFRAFHRTPPMLGVFQNAWFRPYPSGASAKCFRFVPTAGSSQPQVIVRGERWVLDCRHGHVLLFGGDIDELRVWDPIAHQIHRVSPLDDLLGNDIAGAVVCAAGHDDHTDCHSSPFKIVLLECMEDDSEVDDYWISARVYSSETGAWSSWRESYTITSPSSFRDSEVSALVGDSLYWKLELTAGGISHILDFDLPRQQLDLIELPVSVREDYMSGIHVMPAEDGGIGFAGVNGSNIHLWSRTIDSEGIAGWALGRVLNLDNLTLSGVPAQHMLSGSSVVGIAKDSHVLFLDTQAGVFMFNIRSMELKKVPIHSGSQIYPYASFYARGPDIPLIDGSDGMSEKQATAQVEDVPQEKAESTSSADKVGKLPTK